MTEKIETYNLCECCGEVIDGDRDVCDECIKRQLE